MEAAAANDHHHHHQQAVAGGEGHHQLGGGGGGKNNNSNNNNGSSSFMCGGRQSSSRWTPTSEQIRILKDLYYNNGVRSPTADQIQRISAKLRQYGKIEGKNVFYWFQNHKARERQKKRFTTNTTVTAPPDHLHHHHHHIPIHNMTRNDHHHHHLLHHHHLSSIYNNSNHLSSHPAAPGNHLPSSSSSSSPANLLNNYAYGSSVAMEKTFRDYCSISPSSGGNGGAMGQNIAWVGVDSSPYPYPFIDNRKYTTTNNNNDHHHHQTLEIPEEEEDQEEGAEIETLPLFPIHGGQAVKHHEIDYFNGWPHRRADDVAGSRASLELTLNSYAPTTSFPTS